MLPCTEKQVATLKGNALADLEMSGKSEHHGIKIEFVGQIELYYDRGNHYEFLSLVKELARPGELTQNTSYDFEFAQVMLTPALIPLSDYDSRWRSHMRHTLVPTSD